MVAAQPLASRPRRCPCRSPGRPDRFYQQQRSSVQNGLNFAWDLITPSSTPTSTPTPESPATTEASALAFTLDNKQTCPTAISTLAPQDLPPTPQNGGEWFEWLKDIDGSSAYFSEVRITLQGTTETAVVVQGMRVHVVNRLPAREGNIYALVDYRCGGGIDIRSFEIHLDEVSPKVVPVVTELEATPNSNPVFRVSNTEPEVFAISAYAQSCDCSWYLELDWTSVDRKGTIVIDNSGQPFRTATPGTVVPHIYDWEAARWLQGDSRPDDITPGK